MSDIEKLSLKEVVIVEGKYDKIRLQSVISSPIITLNGFRIFKDKEAQTLIRKLAASRGILIMTDVDSAGFVLRNFLKGIVDEKSIKHCYIPVVYGKEKRKRASSKEGKLGVEGVSNQVIIDAVQRCGIEMTETPNPKGNKITKQDLYALGLSGRSNSAVLRKAVIQKLQLPEHLSANGFLEVVNLLYTTEELQDIVDKI